MEQEEDENKCPHGMEKLNPGAELCHRCCFKRHTIYCLLNGEKIGPHIMNHVKPKKEEDDG